MNHTDESSLENSLILAMPSLVEPLFYHSVIYICEHSDEGAMGIMINRPLDIHVADVLKQLEFLVENPTAESSTVLCGGPVQMQRGFVLHDGGNTWEGSVELEHGLSISSSKDILQAIAENRGPENMLVALGYAGWQPGQLEKEFSENSWVKAPVQHQTLFETPYENRWNHAANQAGIDWDRLVTTQVGHA